MRIYFCRHGESQANLIHAVSNRGLRHGLTQAGRQQAAALADRLARLQDEGRPLTRIYASPVLRALETSILLANHLHLEYEVTDALREYDCGEIEGRSDEAAWQQWRELFDAWVIHRQWERRIPGGENFHDLQARFVPFIDGLVQQFGGTETGLVCVSHGGIYWMMLPLVLANVNHALIQQYDFDYTTCITAELTPNGLVCLDWNGVTL